MTDTSIKKPGDAPTIAEWPAAVPELDAMFVETIGTPEGRRDPYARYRALREVAPVYRTGMGMVVCTRYEECNAVLRDTRFGKGEGIREDALRARFGELEIFPRILEQMTEQRSLLFMNPPDHSRLRGLVSKAFTPRTVERLRPSIVKLVDDLLDKIPAGEVIDVMDMLAFPLPASVIASMLGVPSTDWEQFRTVMSRATLLLEPIISDEDVESAVLAQSELEEYFVGLVSERRRQPEDDLISQLIAVQEGSDRLSETELISTALLLFGAGFETTTNLIGNGLLALLTHPDQLARLRSERSAETVDGHDSTVLRSAVEELLRYDSPVQFDGRECFEDLEIAGVPVGKGEEVVTVLGAANRDPEHWTDPDGLDLHRDEGPPMSFASGIHFCLGAALARAEGQVVFDRLLERFGSIELATDAPEFRNRITLRGLVDLPVVCSN
jgi:cytochrome P450